MERARTERGAPEQRGPLERLLERLELERLDRDLFLGEPGRGEGRLFGGMVAAQSVIAAGRTVEPAVLHSLHGYFLRPGSHQAPITFVVDRIRDGRTFTTRSVVAHQGGEAIFTLSASFARTEDGISHQDPMPEAPDPDTLPDWEDMRVKILGDESQRRRDNAVELRMCDPEGYAGEPKPPSQMVWIRPRGRVPDDPLLHAAVLVYASDREGVRGIWLHSPSEGEDRPVVTRRDFGGRDAQLDTPVFSPDGRFVAYSALKESGEPGLWISGVAGGPPVPLAGGKAVGFAPTWSPDGRSIAFMEGTPLGKFALARAAVGASLEPERIAEHREIRVLVDLRQIGKERLRRDEDVQLADDVGLVVAEGAVLVVRKHGDETRVRGHERLHRLAHDVQKSEVVIEADEVPELVQHRGAAREDR